MAICATHRRKRKEPVTAQDMGVVCRPYFLVFNKRARLKRRPAGIHYY